MDFLENGYQILRKSLKTKVRPLERRPQQQLEAGYLPFLKAAQYLIFILKTKSPVMMQYKLLPVYLLRFKSHVLITCFWPRVYQACTLRATSAPDCSAHTIHLPQPAVSQDLNHWQVKVKAPEVKLGNEVTK